MKSWFIILVVKDLEMDVVVISIKKSIEEDKVKIKKLFGKDGILLEKGNVEIFLKVIVEIKVDMFIVGGCN